MKVTGPELALIAATRGMLGVGIGLLVANRLTEDHRRVVGRVLLGIGAASTIPLAMQVFRRRSEPDWSERTGITTETMAVPVL